MANLNVHAAQLTDGLGTRLIVAYKQIPGNPLRSLVIKLDSMTRDVDREELRSMVTSPEGQAERDFINILHKKNLLKFYHDNKYFSDVAIDDVVMTPGNGQSIPLREVINSLNQRNGLGPLPTPEQLKNLSEKDPASSMKRDELMQAGSKTAMAKNALIQAKLMQDEVNKKIKQALELDPSVKPIADRILQGLALEEPIRVELATPAKVQKKSAKAKSAKTKTAAN